MRLISLLAILVTVCGCQVTKPLADVSESGTKEHVAEPMRVESKSKEPTLWEMTSPESHIDQGDWCYHDGKKIQVLQVAEEVKDGDVQLYCMICITKPYDYNRMTIGVVSRHAYVSDEMLRSGYYQYLNPHTYKTKNGDSKTIRMYLEEPQKKELTDKENAELGKGKKGE